MNLIDADGKFGDPFSLTFYAASAVALGVGITIAATYQATRTSYKNYGRMPTKLEVELTATKMLLDVANEVVEFFSKKAKDKTSESSLEIKGKKKNVERPNISKTGESAQEQLEGIEKQDSKNKKYGKPEKINSIEKSKQNLKNKLKEIKNLDDAKDSWGI